MASMEDINMCTEQITLPGFRFHPTEEELLDFYLKNMVVGKKLRYDVIGFLNIYHHDPCDLPGILLTNQFPVPYYVLHIFLHINLI